MRNYLLRLRVRCSILPHMEDIRERVRAELARQERTAAWLAKRLGVHRSRVVRWLSDEPIPSHRFLEIALVLGKPRDWLKAEPAEAAA